MAMYETNAATYINKLPQNSHAHMNKIEISLLDVDSTIVMLYTQTRSVQ